MGRRGRQLPPTGPGRTLLCAPVCRMTFRSSTFPTGTRDILSPYAAPPAPRGPGGGRSPGPPPRSGRDGRGRACSRLPAGSGPHKVPPPGSTRWRRTGGGDGSGLSRRGAPSRGDRTARRRLQEQAGSGQLRRGACGGGTGAVAGPARAEAGGGRERRRTRRARPFRSLRR